MIRIFIIFHDCGHGAFFNSKRMNTITGFITGLLCYVPYHEWRHSHAQHHASCSDLDRRGIGDVWTLTVSEYQKLTPGRQFLYRLYRNPLIMFVLGPVYMVMINNRLVTKGSKKRERRSVHLGNIGIVVIFTGMGLLIGLKSFLMIQVPVVLLAWTCGIWLFYVQHQFEDAYWAPNENWEYYNAAIQGSSFYKLPRVLQWFTGNIGFHHVHHLSSRIPNYYLPLCHEQIPEFKNVPPVHLINSIKLMKLRLYDENKKCMIGFNDLSNAPVGLNS